MLLIVAGSEIEWGWKKTE